MKTTLLVSEFREIVTKKTWMHREKIDYTVGLESDTEISGVVRKISRHEKIAILYQEDFSGVIFTPGTGVIDLIRQPRKRKWCISGVTIFSDYYPKYLSPDEFSTLMDGIAIDEYEFKFLDYQPIHDKLERMRERLLCEGVIANE